MASTTASERPRSILLAVHLNILVYAFCFWVTNPILPYLLKEHGATSLTFGYFQSLFSIVQVVGGLFIGDLQDRYSGPTALSLTQLGSALVYGCLAVAGSLEILYLSRLPTILQQSMQVAQACVSKVSEPAARPAALGRLSLSYAVGMVLGSSLSGFIAEAYGNRVPAAIAFAISIGAVGMNQFSSLGTAGGLRSDAQTTKSNTSRSEGSEGVGSSPSSPSPVAAPSSKQRGWRGYAALCLELPRTVSLLALMFSARALYEPVSNITLIDRFHVRPAQMSLLATAVGGLGFFSNVVVLPFALRYLRETALMKISLLLTVGGFLLVSLEASLEAFAGGLAVIALSSALLYTLSTSHITHQTSVERHGQAIALTHALRAGVGILCPVLATHLLSHLGGSAVALLNVFLLLTALSLVS